MPALNIQARAAGARLGDTNAPCHLIWKKIGLVPTTTQSDAIESLDVQLVRPSPGLLTLRLYAPSGMSRIRVGPRIFLALWITCGSTRLEAFHTSLVESHGYYELQFFAHEAMAVTA